MENKDKLVILIDDDMISNILAEEVLISLFPRGSIYSYTDPLEGLFTLMENLKRKVKIVLFLDINMPGMSGWELLDALMSSGLEDIKNNINIYMVSSSLDIKDKSKAHNCPIVTGYLEKPLSEKSLEDVHWM